MKWIKQTFVALLGVLFIVSCEYEFIEVATPEPPDPNDTTIDTVSFAGVIEPIFESSSCTNCHNGGTAWDLTTGNAYNSIIAEDAVVPFNPDASSIYTVPHPNSSSSHTKYNSVSDANSIYTWIYQGALDN